MLAINLSPLSISTNTILAQLFSPILYSLYSSGDLLVVIPPSLPLLISPTTDNIVILLPS